MTHEGFQDIRESPVEEGVRFREHAVVVDVIVHHEGEGAETPYYQQQMGDSMQQMKVVK